jgi:hypothetical protein
MEYEIGTPALGSTGWYANLKSWDANGFTLTINNDGANSRTLHYVVWASIDSKVKLGTTRNTTTGTKAYTGYGFEPQALLMLGTKFSGGSLPYAASNTQADSFSFGAGIGTGSRQEFYHSHYDQDAVGTSVTQALCDEGIFHIFSGAKTTFVEGNIDSLDSDGFTLNFTTVDSLTRAFACLAFGPEPAETSLPSTAGVFKAYCIT